VVAALEQRWHELPTGVRTPGQMLGRKLTGCEGTHGVFPACNFGCKPCYLSANANRVRVDGTHTVAEVDRQMAFLRERRGPAQYAQLIGGEVSLLPAEAHAEALAVMRRYGRMPMSFSHGDFDYEYRSSSGACATRGRRRRRRRRTRTRTDAATYATCPLQLQAS
jgi:sulfatase maturation enzyme AslB (radical SAM superfamily)